MILRDAYIEADTLARMSDMGSLVERKTACDRGMNRAGILGSVSLIALFFGDRALRALLPLLVESHAIAERCVVILLPAVGCFVSIALAKRIGERRDLLDLALELKRRESAADERGA